MFANDLTRSVIDGDSIMPEFLFYEFDFRMIDLLALLVVGWCAFWIGLAGHIVISHYTD